MKKITENNLYSGRWLSLKESVYENKNGDLVRWESVVRKNNSSSVVIIAKLIPSQRFVLIKQFRPAINGYILGFPAGIDNHCDSQIIKELKEETGYTGFIKHKGPLIKSQAGIINDSGRVVFVHIDENDEANKNPKQQLGASEDIEVIIIPANEIKQFLLNSIKQAVAISANLWYVFVASQWISEET